jgi:hypothetical protein
MLINFHFSHDGLVTSTPFAIRHVNEDRTRNSNTFVLPELPSAIFGFFFTPGFDLIPGKFGVVLKKSENKEPLNMHLNFWVEYNNGIKLGN